MLWGVAPVNRLALVPADRVIKGNGRDSQSPRRFLDFRPDLSCLFFHPEFIDGAIWLGQKTVTASWTELEGCGGGLPESERRRRRR